MRLHLIVLPIAAIAAPAAAFTPYHAAGTEPFWRLTIDQRTVRLEEAGRRTLTVPAAPAKPLYNGQRYSLRGMSVDVTHTPCRDGMSDRAYRDTVTVRVGRRTLKGCGGGFAVETSRLANTQWTVWQVNGRPVRTERPLTVNFTADRVEGKVCNGYGGDYRMTGNQLTVGRVMSTRMACIGPAQTAETVLFRLWQQPVRASFSRWGTMTLSRGRESVTLRPVRR